MQRQERLQINAADSIPGTDVSTSHSPPQENTGTAAVEELLSSVKMDLCLTEPSVHSPHPCKAKHDLLVGAHQAAPAAHSPLSCPSGAALRPCEPREQSEPLCTSGNKVWLDNPVIGYRTSQ